MKKIAVLCVICLLLTSIPVFAGVGDDITVALKSASDETLTVSGSAPNNSLVKVTVYNPGFTADDIDKSASVADSLAVQYFTATLSKAGKFSVDIKIKTEEGGIFTAVVYIAGTEYEKVFSYYPYSLKGDYVSTLKTEKNPETLEEQLPEILEIYGLDTHDLYLSTTDAKLASLICSKNGEYTITNPDNAYVFLNEMLVLNAFQSKNVLLIKGNFLSYDDVWAGADNNLFADYKANISSKGQQAINSAMLSGTYSNSSDIYDKFESLALYHLIMNYAAAGNGHIETLVATTYKNQYAEAGFDRSLLAGATNKKTKLNNVLNCGATSLATLADKFNEIMAETSSGNTGSSGGSGGSVSGGGSGGGNKAPTSGGTGFVEGEATPTPTVAPTTTPEPSAPVAGHPFTDMADAQWADVAVKYLYEKKIINGRTETEFVPSADLTRAELVKMICEAFGISESAEENIFSDVSENDWFAPFVKKAAAAGIVKGDAGAFRPNNVVTREDAALIIFRALDLENIGKITFTDADEISDYAKEAIASMFNAGYISGMGDGTFSPKTTLTRAQAAQLIYNALTKGGAAK